MYLAFLKMYLFQYGSILLILFIIDVTKFSKDTLIFCYIKDVYEEFLIGQSKPEMD